MTLKSTPRRNPLTYTGSSEGFRILAATSLALVPSPFRLERRFFQSGSHEPGDGGYSGEGSRGADTKKKSPTLEAGLFSHDRSAQTDQSVKQPMEGLAARHEG